MTGDGKTITFDYNHEGLCVRKTVTDSTSTTETNYTLQGKNLVHLTQGDYNLHFFYDTSNKPAVVNFKGTKYGYVQNLQGDIIQIIDANGAVVVEYTYDAWGKVLNVTGSMADTLGKIQPFRYRGYVYDVETGLYYLKSRCYNPLWQRFVNADEYVNENLFEYCKNNTPNSIDTNGKDSVSLAKSWAETMSWLPEVDGPLPIGEAIYFTVLGGLIIEPKVEEAINYFINVYEAIQFKKKAVNLPSADKISINLDHIMSGHSANGNRGGPNKDRFPDGITGVTIERIIREAYRHAEKIETQGERVFLRGSWGNNTIEMWVNLATKTIESAWPKYK